MDWAVLPSCEMKGVRQQRCRAIWLVYSYVSGGMGRRPGKLTYLLVGGRKNMLGFTSLESPLWFKHKHPSYVKDHSVLQYLGKKIADFLHDYHGDWSLGHKAWPTYHHKMAKRNNCLHSRSRKFCDRLQNLLMQQHCKCDQRFAYTLASK
jgi:hypothetical protein